jgi:hypothetical protein
VKTSLFLLLAILMLLVGCAPGYYEKGQRYGEEAPGYYETKQWYQNPESEAERAMRMWREDSGR